MYERLHDARFVQNSVYSRNILVQPGPLIHPREERSLDNPSFRLIDFGRANSYNEDESKSANEDLKNEMAIVCCLNYERRRW